MKISIYSILTALVFAISINAVAQKAEPTITFYSIEDKDSVTMHPGEETTQQAPLDVTLLANITEADGWTYKPEWRIYDASSEDAETPLLTRFEPTTQYTITKSGKYEMQFFVTFINPEGQEFEYEFDPMSVSISTSKLSCPDGFSPNNDGYNDVFHVTYQSIVKMEGRFFNRWGQRLYSFDLSNVDDGWDGKVDGKVIKDGVYFLNLQAVGSDGAKYDIKKAINVLTGYRENE